MPSFKAPQYTKTTNPKTGIQEPSYTFPVEFLTDESLLSFVAESEKDISLQGLQKCVVENIDWWIGFIGGFLKSASKLFAKPYTVEQINKIIKHTLSADTSTTDVTYPVNVTVAPKTIQITGGVFVVNWGYTLETMVIDIPDLGEAEETRIEMVESSALPVSNKIIEGVEELDINALPEDTDSTGEALEIENPAKFYEKQRVKEARLKAKLAIYKAQRQMNQYYEKYGDTISDSDSESDFETSDDESDEEVQL
jgi:hypothetical protein